MPNIHTLCRWFDPVAVAALSVSIASAAPPAKPKAADAGVTPPYGITLGSFDSNVSLYLECQTQKPYADVDCQITWMALRKISEEDDRKARAEFADIDKASDKDLADVKQTFSPDNIAKLKARATRATPEQRAALNDFVAFGQEAATATTRPAMKALLGKFQDMQKNTCTIDIWQDHVSLKRAGSSANQWIFNPGPQGLCNVVNVAVLERDPKYQALWRYTVTEVSADSSSALCKGLGNALNRPEVYSWDAPDTIVPGCKYLKVGK